jgi:lysophospholipase L1-like esterase
MHWTPTAWRLTGAACGAAALFALWWGFAGAQPELHPDWWRATGRPADLAMATLAGELRPAPEALDLSGHESVAPRVDLMREGRVRLEATLLEDGQLKIGLGGPGSGEPAPPSRSASLAQRLQDDAHKSGSADAPPRKPELEGMRQPRTTVLVVDRGRRQAIYGVGLDCEEMPAPPERFELELQAGPEAVHVSVDGVPAGSCSGLEGPAMVSLGSGVRRIQVHSFELEAGEQRFAQDFGGGLRGPLGRWGSAALGAALGALLLGRPGRPLPWMPLLASPLLVRRDLRGVLDSLRMLDVPESMGPLLLLGLPTLGLLLGRLARRHSARVALPLSLVPAAALGLALAAFGWSDSSSGLVLLALLALPWTALVWVNTHPFPRRPLASYGLLATLLVLGELGLRRTPLDLTWQRSTGWARASLEFEELLVLREHRDYPSDGFPVRPPEPSGRPRVVAFGGSSTGGAFQMDDLDLFWPAELERLLPQPWEVVNQGVGGWNTLHIRLYAESQMEHLQPDVVAIYVGHNDVLDFSTRRYADYLAQYQGPRSDGGGLLGLLESSRLFVGFKFSVLALGQRSEALAVPVEDARDNLAAIIEAARGVGARVLLLSEGLNPDPLPMADYAAMQRSLAEAEDVHALDTASLLYESGAPDLFLDDCHLSVSGHQALAALVAEELRREGWLEP